MSDDEIVEGLPAASFMPLGRYKFKRLTDLGSVTVPLRGTYPVDGPFSGDYDICPEVGVLLFGTLTQVILAMGKYPTLAENQLFVVAGLEMDGENVTVSGRVVELL